MTDAKLVFDVGANDGADTAYYLRLGYSVVAIEADPGMAARLGERFAEAVAADRVRVVNVAVTEKDCDEVTLYLSRDNTESSLVRSMAERSGLFGSISVAGRSLCSLFDDYGLPVYCKIDIEGNDGAAVRGMSGCSKRPAYISGESTGQPIGEVGRDEGLLFGVLDALAAQGYRQFKLVDQESLQVLADAGHYDRLHSWPVRIRTKIERWRGRSGEGFGSGRFGMSGPFGVSGQFGMSGPFGEGLAGEWADYEVTRRRMSMHFSHYNRYTKNKQFIFWVDIHGKY